MLGLNEAVGMTLLKRVWLGAGAGIIKSLAFPGAAKWLSALIYISLGVTVVPYWKETIAAIGLGNFALVALGGLLFIIGAVIYAAHWPNPAPYHFGYHEIFHIFVIAAATLHYIAVWRLVHGLHLK